MAGRLHESDDLAGECGPLEAGWQWGALGAEERMVNRQVLDLGGRDKGRDHRRLRRRSPTVSFSLSPSA